MPSRNYCLADAIMDFNNTIVDNNRNSSYSRSLSSTKNSLYDVCLYLHARVCVCGSEVSGLTSPQVFLHPNSPSLWREYLLFTQSHFSTFTVSRVNAAYGKCLSTLSAVQDGSMVSHLAIAGTEEEMLGKVFSQML